MRWVVGAGIVAAGMLFSTGALAQEQALAVSHFDRGLAAMKTGDYGTACPALAESFRLDKRPGTLFTLADCEMSQGKLAAALVHFTDYMEWFDRMTPEQRANQRGREQVVPERQKTLRERVPHVTFKGAPAGATVELDHVALGSGSIGVPLPLDPGHHEVAVSAPGHAPHTTAFDLAEREKKEVVLELGPALPANAPGAPVDTTAPPVTGDGGSSTRRTLAFGAGGLAIVGAGVGTVFGILTMGHKSTIEDHCVSQACDPAGLDAVDASRTTGLVSTIGFIVGGAAIAAAFLLWPGSKSTTASAADLRLRW